MPTGKKMRIYDLAREIKQDAKRVMEELRREGADVSVPSNSVSFELAEKIRLRYFPKAEVAPKRAIKIIKATKKEDAPAVEEAEIPAVAEASPIEAEVVEAGL
ncbi:MAG: translation initiation factor IF-2 N-terminal domain-containing protein [Pyrinomonadaceae bacterium]